jgi:hypothetical protein
LEAVAMIAAATTLAYAETMDGTQWSGTSDQERLRNIIALPPAVHAATNEYADTDGLSSEFSNHFAKLRAIGNEKSLWPVGAEAPSAFAEMWARITLQQLEVDRFLPTRVTASAEGGIAICFVDGEKYADLEFLNTGEILGVISNRRDRPVAWEIKHSSRELARAAARIRQFFNAPATR